MQTQVRVMGDGGFMVIAFAGNQHHGVTSGRIPCWWAMALFGGRKG